MDASTNSKVRLLCSQGDKLSKLGDYDRAVSKYYEALTLLPDMHARNNITAFLYASIGEAYWSMKDYENAGQSFCEAYECPGMNENPQITLRIGQCLIECGDIDNARDYLRHAVRLGGDDIVKNIERRYLQVLYPEMKNEQQPAKNAGIYASGVTRGPVHGGNADRQPAYGTPAQPGAREPVPAAGDARNGGSGAASEPNGVYGENTDPWKRDGAAASSAENGESSFGFVSEVFGEQQRPAESSRFTMSAEDMKPREPDYPREGSHSGFEEDDGLDEFIPVPSGPAERPRQEEKQGFFSRIFGRKK